eukprot:57701-Amphidinium_carterae.1
MLPREESTHEGYAQLVVLIRNDLKTTRLRITPNKTKPQQTKLSSHRRRIGCAIRAFTPSARLWL